MKKRKILSIVALFLLIGVAGTFIVSTYAKYTASVSKRGSAVVAKWNFATDNSATTFEVDLKENYDESTLLKIRNVDGIEKKIIAPGTEGSFDIALINTSEVGVNFTVSLGEISNLPANVKFYKDASYTQALIPGTDDITGDLVANDAEGVTVHIYWRWLYETGTVTDGIATGDTQDNNAGVLASELTIPVMVKGVQAMPGTSAITSHIN